MVTKDRRITGSSPPTDPVLAALDARMREGGYAVATRKQYLAICDK
jgi:hypothetical protein